MGELAHRYDIVDNQEKHHVAYTFGEIQSTSAVKFHSIMQDHELLLDSQKYEHLMKSINYLKKNSGVLIFMDHEERTMSKIRDYGVGAQIIKSFGIDNIELITNSIDKEFIGVSGFGLKLDRNIGV